MGFFQETANELIDKVRIHKAQVQKTTILKHNHTKVEVNQAIYNPKLNKVE